MLADLLAAAVNPNVGAWRLAPLATDIEAQTVRWLAEAHPSPKACTQGLSITTFRYVRPISGKRSRPATRARRPT